MKIDSDTKLEPRLYELTSKDRALIEINSDNLVLDLNGAVLNGKDFKNYGIYIHDCRNVTIINGMIKGFYYGIYAENVSNLRVDNNVVSHNYNNPNCGWLDDGFNPNEKGFGGGIYLFTQEFVDDIPRRLAGPGRMRFLVQPTVALVLGVLAGRRDSRAGRPPFLLALILVIIALLPSIRQSRDVVFQE